MRCATLFASAVLATWAVAETVWVTPHDSFSSSVGVLGCKVNVDRTAYWPAPVDCTNICVSLKYEDRSVYLLRIDQSGGAHDVSFDAWNYLVTGYSAHDRPTAGGAVAMETENVDPSFCADLILTDDHKLPFSAANSMNFIASCLGQPDSWVAKNYVFYNILDSICTWGQNEVCVLKDFPNANQPSCPNTLGAPLVLTGEPVYNIMYPTGAKVLAGTNQIVANATGESGSLPGQPQKNLAMRPTFNFTSPIAILALLVHWAIYRI